MGICLAESFWSLWELPTLRYYRAQANTKTIMKYVIDSHKTYIIIWAASSEFVSSSIPSWQILTAHAQPFRGARDLAFCLKVPLDSLLVWASSEGSGETVRMRRLAWTFAARIGDKYQIRLTRSIYQYLLGIRMCSILACDGSSQKWHKWLVLPNLSNFGPNKWLLND